MLEHNSNHYTITTQYANDPVNVNRVLSRIVLSNVKHDNAGTYTCQCVYNPKVIVDDKDVVSESASFCLEVKPDQQVKPGQRYDIKSSYVLQFPLDRPFLASYNWGGNISDAFDLAFDILEKTKEKEI